MQHILYRSIPTDSFTDRPTEAPSKTQQHAELLLSAALHLMSHYSVKSVLPEGSTACLKLASVIERHLKALSEMPEMTPVLLATCQQLHEQWAGFIDEQLILQQKKSRYSFGLFGSDTVLKS
ncbi:hypothetical protein [Undibacterium sp. SXout20W]|uniref:hypothetical protein n=1 Tax=Undibacterium sp. SXout20W TaxID=3413051 RepID=UPI003BF11929